MYVIEEEVLARNPVGRLLLGELLKVDTRNIFLLGDSKEGPSNCGKGSERTDILLKGANVRLFGFDKSPELVQASAAEEMGFGMPAVDFQKVVGGGECFV